jgi:ribosomal protein S15P/S13E
MCEPIELFKSRYPLIPLEKIVEIYTQNIRSETELIIKLLEIENRNYTGEQEKYTVKCNNVICSQKNCYYYHNLMQKRRPLYEFKYQCKPCFSVYMNKSWRNPEMCQKGIYCEYCHTENELFHYLNPLIPRVMIVRSDIVIPDKNEASIFRGSEKMNEEIEILRKKIKNLRKEIDARRKDVDIKSRQIPIIEENIMNLKGLLLCCKCNMRIFYNINAPCGHVICEYCTKIEICVRCNNPSQQYRVNN